VVSSLIREENGNNTKLLSYRSIIVLENIIYGVNSYWSVFDSILTVERNLENNKNIIFHLRPKKK